MYKKIDYLMEYQVFLVQDQKLSFPHCRKDAKSEPPVLCIRVYVCRRMYVFVCSYMCFLFKDLRNFAH